MSGAAEAEFEGLPRNRRLLIVLAPAVHVAALGAECRPRRSPEISSLLRGCPRRSM